MAGLNVNPRVAPHAHPKVDHLGLTPDGSLSVPVTVFGTTGDDSIVGTDAAEEFVMRQGGDDYVDGGDREDEFDFGAAYTEADTILGGARRDALILEGDYSAGATIGANVDSVQYFLLRDAHTYDLTFTSMTGFNSYEFTVGSAHVANLLLDASAITNHGMGVELCEGSNVLKGTALDDRFFANHVSIDGDERVQGGAGHDTFSATGDGILDFRQVNLNNIEVVTLDGFDDVILHDRDVEASGLRVQFFNEDGMIIRGGSVFAPLELVGHRDGDTFYSGHGQDTLTGAINDGPPDPDRFIFLSVDHSSAVAPDLITDLDNLDEIDVSLFDADLTTSGDQSIHFVHRFTGDGGEATLRYNPNSDTTFFRIDIDGDAVADFVLKLAGDHRDFDNFTT